MNTDQASLVSTWPYHSHFKLDWPQFYCSPMACWEIRTQDVTKSRYCRDRGQVTAMWRHFMFTASKAPKQLHMSQNTGSLATRCIFPVRWQKRIWHGWHRIMVCSLLKFKDYGWLPHQLKRLNCLPLDVWSTSRFLFLPNIGLGK